MGTTRLVSTRYVPDRMRSVGEIVRSRLAEIGMFQKDFAALVGLDGPAVSRILDGERLLPVEDAARWGEALRLTDAPAKEFVLAVHLSLSTDLVRTLVDDLTMRNADAHAVLAVYEDKARGAMRFIEAIIRASEDRRGR